MFRTRGGMMDRGVSEHRHAVSGTDKCWWEKYERQKARWHGIAMVMVECKIDIPSALEI